MVFRALRPTRRETRPRVTIRTSMHVFPNSFWTKNMRPNFPHTTHAKHKSLPNMHHGFVVMKVSSIKRGDSYDAMDHQTQTFLFHWNCGPEKLNPSSFTVFCFNLVLWSYAPALAVPSSNTKTTESTVYMGWSSTEPPPPLRVGAWMSHFNPPEPWGDRSIEQCRSVLSHPLNPASAH